jgi:hypothetical protein
MTQENNPTVSPLLRWVTGVETLVLFIAGVGLFFLPEKIGPHWPWALAPFNTRFIAGVYAAAFVAALIQTWTGRWSPARLVTPMIFVFTALVFILSVVYANRFNWSSPVTIVWYFLYLALPLNAGWHLWRYRHWLPADPTKPVGLARYLLTGQSVVLGGYGLLLLLMPAQAVNFWPWKPDVFHAQLYSVACITPAVGSALLLRGGDRMEWRTMGLTQIILGEFPLVGLMWVDCSVNRVVWSSAGTVIWCGLFAAIMGMGVWMLAKK